MMQCLNEVYYEHSAMSEGPIIYFPWKLLYQRFSIYTSFKLSVLSEILGILFLHPIVPPDLFDGEMS